MKKKRFTGNPWLSSALIWIMAVMMILALLLPDHSYSSTENRPLARSADWSLDAEYDGTTGKDLNSWFSDQIPGRNLFFHLNYIFRKALGQFEIKDVFLGKGALLANPEAVKNDSISKTVRAINDFQAASDLPCYVLTSPSAASVQQDKLPFEAPVRDVNPVLNQIGADLSGPIGVDVRGALGEHASEYIYYKTDHHWTSLGAGYAAKTLLAAMGIEMNLSDFDRMPVSENFQGTLASKTGSVLLKDSIDIAVSKNNPQYVVTWSDGTQTSSIYKKDALHTKDQYQVFLGANQSIVRIDTNLDSSRTLLLFKDSYANSMIQYLLPYFSSITIVDPRYYYQDLNLVLSSDLFSDVAFVYSYDTMASVSSLADLLSGWMETAAPPAESQEAEASTDENNPENEPAADEASSQESPITLDEQPVQAE